ncbi:MAG: hypothetical protein ACPGYY_09995, partial [Bacteroidia bacterium]
MIKKNVFLFSILTACLSWTASFGQSPENLLGLTYNSLEISKLIGAFNTDNPEESFMPYQKVYKLDYPKDGIYMEFNSDVALYRVALYDSGFRYQKYAGPLPYGIEWGMSLADVEERTSVLDFTDQNIFIRKRITEDYSMDFYFSGNGLNHIKITSTIKRLRDKKDHVLQSTGIRLLPDGQTLSGNVLDGIGTMMWGNGAAKYQGEWSYGLPHGKGQYIDSFGNKYDGEFKLGFFWGKAKFFSDAYQYSYTGQYVMGKKHNFGKIIYSNKTSYEGDWSQDLMEGQGTYFAGPNYVYKGMMKSNSFNGKGSLETPAGVITGSFKNGKPHGICTQVSKDLTQSVKGNFI